MFSCQESSDCVGTSSRCYLDAWVVCRTQREGASLLQGSRVVRGVRKSTLGLLRELEHQRSKHRYYLKAHRSVNITLSIDLPNKRKRRRDTDVNMKDFEKNAKQRFEEWEAEGELDLERLERDLLKHVRQSKLNEIDLSTIGNVTVDREDEISMIASRSFGQPSFGIETDVNAFVDQYDDEIKFDEDDAFSPPPPMSPVSNKIKPDALNAIRPQRVSSPAPSSTAAPSLGDDDDAATMVSQVTSNATPLAPSKKHIRLCAIDVNTKLQFARPAPLTFAGTRFDLDSLCSETDDDTDSTASSSFPRKLKRRKIRRSSENLVIVGPSFLMGGAAPALMELWKKQTSAAVPQVEQLRAGGSRRSSVRGVRARSARISLTYSEFLLEHRYLI